MTVPSRFEAHKTFAINTPSDMLAKLMRELYRAANSSTLRDDLLDHNTNCALTAWSLTDWVWQARFKDDPAAQDRPRVVSAAGSLDLGVAGGWCLVRKWAGLTT